MEFGLVVCAAIAHPSSNGAHGISVPVTVMDVGVMRMRMADHRVLMRMAVRFGTVPAGCVSMLVVLVMHMPVLVFKRFMRVLVFVSFAHVQPHS